MKRGDYVINEKTMGDCGRVGIVRTGPFMFRFLSRGPEDEAVHVRYASLGRLTTVRTRHLRQIEDPAKVEEATKWVQEGIAMAEKKVAKDKKAPKEKKPKETGLCVFALRMTEAERTALHKTAGPGNASQFAREVLVAAAKKDLKALEAIFKLRS